MGRNFCRWIPVSVWIVSGLVQAVGHNKLRRAGIEGSNRVQFALPREAVWLVQIAW
jgi:hypothetical protein